MPVAPSRRQCSLAQSAVVVAGTLAVQPRPAPRAQRAVQMPFQQDADVFAHGATVGAGLPGQIVVVRFGPMQLDIAVALDAATAKRK